VVRQERNVARRSGEIRRRGVRHGIRRRPDGLAKRTSSYRGASEHGASMCLPAGDHEEREPILCQRAVVHKKRPVELETGGLAARSESERTSSKETQTRVNAVQERSTLGGLHTLGEPPQAGGPPCLECGGRPLAAVLIGLR